MLEIGVQTHNIVKDENPAEGFKLMKGAGFDCADFSLNRYLLNSVLYRNEANDFFNQTVGQLENYFSPHVQGAKAAGVRVNQMHMPYPVFIPTISEEVNRYLWEQVAPKSMAVCSCFHCPNLVIHGFKLRRFSGKEDIEWKMTEEFLDTLAPIAKEMGIMLCVENLYDTIAGHIVEGPCCNATKAAERIDRFNDKHGAEILGFCFDTGHANLVGIDFEKFIKTLGHRLKVLHIHDNDGVSDLHQIPFTFSKTKENKPSTDWEGFVRGLSGVGYDGVLSFETAPVISAFPEEMKKDVLGFIARIGYCYAEKIQSGIIR